MKRTASAVWLGNLKQGNGTVSTGNGALENTPYCSLRASRTAPGPIPKNSLPPAHSVLLHHGHFGRRLAAQVSRRKGSSTEATLTLEQVQGSWTSQRFHLQLTVAFPELCRRVRRDRRGRQERIVLFRGS